MPIDEGEDLAGSQLRLLDMRQMAALRDHVDSDLRNILLPHLCVLAGEELVVVAPEHKRRDLDTVQPALERRIEPARLPAKPCGREAVDELDLGLFLARRLLEHPFAERAVVEQVLRALLRRPDEVIAHRNALDAHARRRDERKRRKPRAIAYRSLGSNPAAERIPDEMHLLRVQAIEDVEVIHRHVGDVPDPGWIRRSAESRMLRREHLVLCRELLEERNPSGQSRSAMQEYQHPAAAGAEEAHRYVTRRKTRFLHW